MPPTSSPFRYDGADGAALCGFRWPAAGPPRAILQLAHGAGEHAGRYEGPLGPVVAAGFSVYAADHRGHRMTSGMSHLGDFGPGGAAACVSDMAELSKLARAENPGLPLVLMGHSMGAMFAQAYLLEHPALIDGLVLSGTTGPGPLPEKGPNAAFANPRTDYDWLSRDEAEVDRYIADPFCGIRFTEESRRSFLALRSRELDVEALRVSLGPGVRRDERTFPVYVFVGDEVPINRRL